MKHFPFSFLLVQAIKSSTKMGPDWSYFLAWVGVGFSLISSVFFFMASYNLRTERDREMGQKMQYLYPGKKLPQPVTLDQLQGYFLLCLRTRLVFLISVLWSRWNYPDLVSSLRQPWNSLFPPLLVLCIEKCPTFRQLIMFCSRGRDPTNVRVIEK